MTFGEHSMIVYADINSLREIYSSHSKRSLQSRNNTVVILYHYENRGSIGNALKEFDIEVDRYEADSLRRFKVFDFVLPSRQGYESA
jgi:hypothetical protein